MVRGSNPLGGATFAWMLLMETRISKRVGLNRPKGQLGGSCCPLTSRKLAKSEKHAHWPRKWLENLETQNAIVGELHDIPKCGLFGCDEKAKISGNRWKCVACGKITKAVGE